MIGMTPTETVVGFAVPPPPPDDESSEPPQAVSDSAIVASASQGTRCRRMVPPESRGDCGPDQVAPNRTTPGMLPARRCAGLCGNRHPLETSMNSSDDLDVTCTDRNTLRR